MDESLRSLVWTESNIAAGHRASDRATAAARSGALLLAVAEDRTALRHYTAAWNQGASSTSTSSALLLLLRRHATSLRLNSLALHRRSATPAIAATRKSARSGAMNYSAAAVVGSSGPAAETVEGLRARVSELEAQLAEEARLRMAQTLEIEQLRRRLAKYHDQWRQLKLRARQRRQQRTQDDLQESVEANTVQDENNG